MKSTSMMAALLAAAFALPLQAKIVTQTVPYEHNGKKMQGFLAYDDAKSGPRPGVLVVHEWWGLNDYIRDRTRQVAQMGYVAFAPDMYGEGKTTRDPKEAGAWSGDVRKSGELVPRAKAGLDILRKQKGVDGQRLGAMGFCFGGSTVLALAYSGEPLKGTVLFHGSLFPPEQGAQIKSPIVILHGEKDTFIKPETITQVKDALEAGKVDYYMVTYANAVHAFTNPDADSFKIPGIGYNEKAARRSWDEMQYFFRQQFGAK
jgi:dienelactone hydrolase